MYINSTRTGVCLKLLVLFSNDLFHVINFLLICQAYEMLSNTSGSIPMIFLITDGAVEDERNICDQMKKRLKNSGSLCPRIHTFGIGNLFGIWTS